MASQTKTLEITAMGAVPLEKGCSFRVWAPFADSVSVVGTFNDWNEDRHPLTRHADGHWTAFVTEATTGHEYRYAIRRGDQRLSRIDPYAREVTNSVGNGVIHDGHFDWEGDEFKLPPFNELVIYELHIGTFVDSPGDGPGTFATAEKRLSHLKKLGINAVEILPVAEFPGDRSWGYNPAHIFAVESAYGGPQALKKFVKRCHQLGIGVILDVVYNHFGPTDLDLWQFDGWSENGKGGIYFYNDQRSATPWGDTRPDYGRPEVCRMLRDNAAMWLDDYHIDGLRYDATLYMRTIDGKLEIPEAWPLFQSLNGEISHRFPGKILIAEDLQDHHALTAPIDQGGAGFHAQWCAHFVHPVRQVVATPEDDQRSMAAVAEALLQRFNDDVFQRVIYSESHDEVANGKQRVTSEVDPENPQAWFARRRSTLAAALTLTAPGIPMLFQGQEFLEAGWFQDTVPLDWDLSQDYRGIVRLYRDLISLRRNLNGTTAGLLGQGIEVFRRDEEKNVLGFLRYAQPEEEVVVVAHFANLAHDAFRIGLPGPGRWEIRLNTDSSKYSPDYEGPNSGFVEAESMAWDGLPCSAELNLAPYSLLILSREATREYCDTRAE